ncbi:MAG: M15 family metallopeptidase, partial [Allobaculum sp.]|nr:M15 family metallopeptidase [Allobaculum sp.]
MSKPKKSVSSPSKKAKSSKKTSSRPTSRPSSHKKKPISSTKSTKKTPNRESKKPSSVSKKTTKKKAQPRLRTNRLVLVTLIVFLMGGGLGYMLYRYGPELLPVIEQIVNNEKTNQLATVSHAAEVQQIKRQNVLDEVDVSGFSDNELRQCFYSADIDDTILTRLQNMGYTNQIPTSSLKYVRVLYYDYENRPTIGELVVNAEMAKPVENVFFDLFLHKYQIARMILPDAYGTRISESYADNNTVALCFGLTEDNRGSVQAQGYGIDLNPLQNPLIKDNGSSFSVFPMEGQLYLDRSVNSPHFIYQDDYAVKAFKKEGFIWTGNIEGINNYKHFEYSKADLPALPHPIKHDEDSENGEKKSENENSQSDISQESQEQGSDDHEDHSATSLESK